MALLGDFMVEIGKGDVFGTIVIFELDQVLVKYVPIQHAEKLEDPPRVKVQVYESCSIFQLLKYSNQGPVLVKDLHTYLNEELVKAANAEISQTIQRKQMSKQLKRRKEILYTPEAEYDGFVICLCYIHPLVCIIPKPEEKTKMGCKQLPRDIMEEILLKIPVKSLMHCKTLNKATYALITSHSFIEKHFELSKSQPGMLVFHCPTLIGFSATLLSDEISQPVTDLELPWLSDKIIGEITPYGPCNGIFCLHLTYLDCTDDLCLWNPTTREVKVLPLPHYHPSMIDDIVIHGFGIVPGTNDYKVARILTDMDFGIEDCKPFNAEVYNLGTNSWRKINVTEAAYSLVSPEFCSYLNGVYHWLTLGLSDEAIICFDMSDDAFWKMKLPENADDDSAQLLECNVAVINESIAYVTEFNLNYTVDIRIEIWVMNEYGVEASWNRRYIIGPGLGPLNFLGFWKEDEILVGEDDGPLITYNPQARQQVQEFPINVATEMFHAFRYVESIFPLSVLEEEYVKLCLD